MEKVHTALFHSGQTYPEKQLYYSGVFVSIEFTCVFVLFPLQCHLSLSEQGGGKRRWWKRLLYVFSMLGTNSITCCSCHWFWQVFEICSFPLWYRWRGIAGWLCFMPRRGLLDPAVMSIPCLLWCLLKSILNYLDFITWRNNLLFQCNFVSQEVTEALPSVPQTTC